MSRNREKDRGKVLAFKFQRLVMENGTKKSHPSSGRASKQVERMTNNKRSFKNLQPCDSFTCINFCEHCQGYPSFSERNEFLLQQMVTRHRFIFNQLPRMEVNHFLWVPLRVSSKGEGIKSCERVGNVICRASAVPIMQNTQELMLSRDFPRSACLHMLQWVNAMYQTAIFRRSLHLII